MSVPSIISQVVVPVGSAEEILSTLNTDHNNKRERNQIFLIICLLFEG